MGPILALRGGYTFGFMLNTADRQGMNAGIGPLPEGGRPGSFIAPNELVGDRLQTEVAGITLDIMHVPSEAPDELAIYLPEDNILIDTEVLQGPTFPNVYTLRAPNFRIRPSGCAALTAFGRSRPTTWCPPTGNRSLVPIGSMRY